jgi:hypothetical protein
MSTTPKTRFDRTEQFQLVAAALRGTVAGVARAIVAWLIELTEEGIHHYAPAQAGPRRNLPRASLAKTSLVTTAMPRR